jgi:hypothetical protein
MILTLYFLYIWNVLSITIMKLKQLVESLANGDKKHRQLFEHLVEKGVFGNGKNLNVFHAICNIWEMIILKGYRGPHSGKHMRPG